MSTTTSEEITLEEAIELTKHRLERLVRVLAVLPSYKYNGACENELELLNDLMDRLDTSKGGLFSLYLKGKLEKHNKEVVEDG